MGFSEKMVIPRKMFTLKKILILKMIFFRKRRLLFDIRKPSLQA